ncbi:hypothetical protein SAMN05421846_10392 [Chryseobacterium taeanense]|uniref:DUF4329 domain-containing protein n=1 Tax=Chryseobacterium taeanense TaxID=311334 RepID=A0A1G8GSP5_9FLAO|nr:hypothetical protein [Chryseobacterium taeanense]SDH97389.1 hypothetical protein SAMN05421846_10392 [Chryseobacterium taeanense]
MTKKISSLSFMAVFLFLLNSCVHDEIYSASASEEYHSKSLWKEDEIYIKNIIKIYEENENEIRKEHGAALWEYAMTMDKFDESYLVVPVRRNGRIVEVLEVPRFGRKVYFRYSDDDDKVVLFNQLMTDRPKKTLPASSVSMASKIVCVVKTFSTWYPDNENNPSGSGHWETSSYTICTDLTIDSFENPDDGGGNVGYDYPPLGGGYENPTDSIVVNQTPCEKTENMLNNTKFKQKVTAIDKPEVFDYDHEMGFASAYPVNTTVTDIQYQPMENSLGTHSVKLPDGNQYFGYIHSHNNESNGGTPIKIFSPSDLITFLTNCVRNADEHGSIGDAYCMVITSEGNYMLQYSGTGDYSIGPNQVNNWKKWYKDKYEELVRTDELTQLNVEKTFAQFLAESVNITGLEVYHVEKSSGKASKLNTNGTKTPCP